MKRGLLSKNQGALPFRNNQERGGIFAYALPWERRLASTMGVLFVLFAILYVYFVTSSILNVAAREELVGKVAMTETSVSSLEAEYFAKTENLTEASALSMGFVVATNEVYVQTDNALSLHDAP